MPQVAHAPSKIGMSTRLRFIRLLTGSEGNLPPTERVHQLTKPSWKDGDNAARARVLAQPPLQSGRRRKLPGGHKLASAARTARPWGPRRSGTAPPPIPEFVLAHVHRAHGDARGKPRRSFRHTLVSPITRATLASGR